MLLKRLSILFPVLLLTYFSHSQISHEWTKDELQHANTVKTANYLNYTEKEVILVLNLARLYPKKFVEVELKKVDQKSRYKKTLIKTLNKMSPLKPLEPDSLMFLNAICFAKESGKNGYVGHKRISCEKMNFAECCSYGVGTGREIGLQLLIDHNVPSLGHRKICLDREYQSIGVGSAPHKKWTTCCVLELI